MREKETGVFDHYNPTKMKDDNLLIAKFMDEVVFEKRPRHYIGANESMKPYKLADKLKYHTSWDWLMPVVIKCHEITDKMEELFPDTKDIDDPTGWRAWSYRRVGLSTDITRTCNNVVRFITWYNSTPHP